MFYGVAETYFSDTLCGGEIHELPHAIWVVEVKYMCSKMT